MTNVIVNAIDVLGHEIDEGVVRISAAGVQYAGDSLMLPEYHDQELVAGSTTITGVTPGKVTVSIHWGINRTATFRVNIPDADEITLAELSLQKYDNDPAIVSQVTDAASRAEGAADRAEGVEDLVQAASDSAAASATFAGESATSAGTSATTSDDAAAVAVAALVAAEQEAQEAQEAAASTAMLFSGTGFPEGSVSAPVGSIYTDTAATAGAIRWIKTSGTGNTGWKVEYGDTGWRRLGAESVLNGWAFGAVKYFLIRRQEDKVHLLIPMYGLTGASATASRIFQTPVGFTSFTGGNYGVLGYIENEVSWEREPSSIEKDFNFIITSSRGELTGRVTWDTRDPWPTSLPGTPA